MDLLNAAELHAYRGDFDAAFEALARLEAVLNTGGGPAVERISWLGPVLNSRYLVVLYEDPRWTGWLAEPSPL